MHTTCDQKNWRNYLTSEKTQLPMITTDLAFLCIICVVLSLVTLSPLLHDMLKAEYLWMRQVSGNLFMVLLRRLALAMLLLFILSGAYQFFLSHRFYGPLANLRHTFSKIAEGDFSHKVTLHKNDFLKAEADQVNRVIDRLNHDAVTLSEKVENMSETLALLSHRERNPETTELIQNLQQSVDGCRDVVSAWTIARTDKG